MLFQRWITAVTFWLLTAAFVPVLAGDFTGKTITFVVTTKPGGGYDAYGRLIAKYLEKHLDGATVVVKNVPGAGHLIGSELVYSSPPDGLTIGLFNTGLVYGQIAGSYADKLDLGQLSWIGKAESETRVIMVRKDSPFQSIDDLRTTKDPLKAPISGKGGAAQIETVLLAKLLGWKLKPIFGMQGAEGELALLRGDVDLMVGSRSSLQHYVDSGDARFLLQYGGKQGSDVPVFDRQNSQENAGIFSLIDSQAHYARATAGPPGLSPEILGTLRAAYDAALSDPELLKEAQAANLPIETADGADVQAAITASLHQSPEVVALIKSIVTQE